EVPGSAREGIGARAGARVEARRAALCARARDRETGDDRSGRRHHLASGIAVAPLALEVVLVSGQLLVVQSPGGAAAEYRQESVGARAAVRVVGSRAIAVVAVLVAGGSVEPRRARRIGDHLVVLVAQKLERHV